MNKPSWDDAPEWAEWLAMDADGGWFWFEDKPRPGIAFSEWLPRFRPDGTRAMFQRHTPAQDGEYFDRWRTTKESRPCDSE